MIETAVRERSEALVRTLLDSVRIASVSLTGEGIAEQVAFLRKRLEDWGFTVEVHPTTSHPIIYAEIGPKDAKKTWLTYGHYDVYPADEKQEGWRTRPFEPVVEGDRIWGRGTGDNKGQHLAMLNAIALYRELHGELPVRIKVILEGDEETGSVPLPKFVEANRARLKADFCCYSDGPMFPNDQPVLLMGVRGNLGLEFHAKGARRNLHSGNLGGVSPNPTLELIHLLAEMVDRDGKLLVPGVGYADVTVAPADLAAVRALKVDHAGFVDTVGAEPTTGTDDALFHERLMLRPAFNVSGFSAGYTGAGIKNIIFKEAIAKADVRLVGGQDPTTVFNAIVKFAHDRGYHGIELKNLKGTPASRTPLDHPMVPTVKAAVAKGFGREPLVVPSLGGTTPDFVFTRLLGLPSIVVPLAPYDENNHAPNESTKVSLYLAGVRSGLHLLESLAHACRPPSLEQQDDEVIARPTGRERLKLALERRYSPRLHMSLILGACSLTAMLTSWSMLHLGVHSMLVRYPIAVSLAYCAFLAGVYVWLRAMGFLREPGRGGRSNFDDGGVLGSGSSSGGGGGGASAASAARGGGGSFDGGGASASFAEGKVAPVAMMDARAASSGGKGGSFALGDGIDGDGVVLILLAIALVAIVFVTSGYLIWAAPDVLTEAAFGAALAGTLARAARKESAGGWVAGVMRKTWPPFAVVFVAAIAFAGWSSATYPQASTFRQAIAMALHPQER